MSLFPLPPPPPGLGSIINPSLPSVFKLSVSPPPSASKENYLHPSLIHSVRSSYWRHVVLAPKTDLASTSVVTLPSMAAFHFLDHSSTQNSVPLAWLLSPSLFLCLILLSLRLFSLTHLRSSFPILPLTCWYSLVFPAQSTGPLIPLAFPLDLMCTVVRLPSTCHNSLMCVSTLDLSPEAQIHVITWLLDS